jgi:hypothetical protein
MNTLCNKGCGREKHGRSGMCKQCKNEYNKVHYANNVQYYVDKAKAREEKLTAKMVEYKESHPCTDCQQFYPSCVMDFDHLSDKLFNIATDYRRVSAKRLQEEMDKCELVCSNCHRIRTRDRRLTGE